MGFKTPLPPPEARQVRRFERLRPGRTGSLDPDDDETDVIIDLGPSGTTFGALTDEQRLLLQQQGLADDLDDGIYQAARLAGALFWEARGDGLLIGNSAIQIGPVESFWLLLAMLDEIDPKDKKKVPKPIDTAAEAPEETKKPSSELYNLAKKETKHVDTIQRLRDTVYQVQRLSHLQLENSSERQSEALSSALQGLDELVDMGVGAGLIDGRDLGELWLTLSQIQDETEQIRYSKHLFYRVWLQLNERRERAAESSDQQRKKKQTRMKVRQIVWTAYTLLLNEHGFDKPDKIGRLILGGNEAFKYLPAPCLRFIEKNDDLGGERIGEFNRRIGQLLRTHSNHPYPSDELLSRTLDELTNRMTRMMAGARGLDGPYEDSTKDNLRSEFRHAIRKESLEIILLRFRALLQQERHLSKLQIFWRVHFDETHGFTELSSSQKEIPFEKWQTELAQPVGHRNSGEERPSVERMRHQLAELRVHLASVRPDDVPSGLDLNATKSTVQGLQEYFETPPRKGSASNDLPSSDDVVSRYGPLVAFLHERLIHSPTPDETVDLLVNLLVEILEAGVFNGQHVSKLLHGHKSLRFRY